jgi:lipoyl(octanoyl) transferase
MINFEVMDLGHMGYEPCLDIQKNLLEEVAESRPNTLILVEHDPILTLGANFHEENLLLPVAEYERRGIQVIRTDRGGDVTYHGPGQLVAYPIFRVERDLHKWLRSLEEAVIVALSSFGIEGYRFPPNTGVWVNEKKICAIGIKVRRWVSMHGLALNCDADLSAFSLIVPCGIHSHGVTSLSIETDRAVCVEQAKTKLIDGFRKVFPSC